MRQLNRSMIARLSMLLVPVIIACSDDSTEPTPLPGVPFAVAPAGGDDQSAIVSTELALPLSVQVTDGDGVPVPAVEVAWTVTGGTLSSSADTTDANGTSSVRWTMPDTPGAYDATASVPGLGVVTFDAEAVLAAGELVFRFVDAGGFHACGLTTTDQIVCWGYNADGQLGGEAGPPALYPTIIPGDPRYRVVTGGMYHGCAIDFAFEITCWGENRDLRALNGSRRSYQDVDAGLTHSCAITIARAVACWGYRHQGQVGDGIFFPEVADSAIIVGLDYEAVSAGGLHTCGIERTGNARCWGFNGDGQLGLGSITTPVNVPTDVATAVVFRVDPVATPPSPDPDFPLPEGPYITAGYAHSCAIAAAGPTYCWGLNQTGQLGDGTTANHSAPAVVSGGLGFVRISAGFKHTCGLTSAGELYCWGDNTWGQLGDGTIVNKSAPTLVSGGLLFAYAKAGETFTCGVTTTGVAYCWGDNHYGQLGTGTNVASLVPVKVALQP